MKLKKPKFTRSVWFTSSIGLIAGTLVVLGVRFATYHPPNQVHYHANFAVYINGQQEQFKGPLYYEETEMCAVSTIMTPGNRAHMHDNVNNVIHVEDQAVTWGQFFENLGWSVGKDFINAYDKMYANDGVNTLSIILNDQDLTGISSITNKVIGDQDRLLIDYGSTSQQNLEKEFQSVPATARKYDVTKDPASCSGHKMSNLHDRLVHMF